MVEQEQTQIRVMLLPDGRVAAEGSTQAIAEGATWERLGCVWDNGTEMAFVRAEISGVSWAAFVNQAALDERAEIPIVTLRRQGASTPAQVSGWILFC
jgi:hypothetical protein